jgi:pimeloyl-ACP methyl ester carboxylesterase
VTRLHVDGRRVALTDRGEGPPVVFVHASGMGAQQWGATLPRLADRFRCLAPDLLGVGASDPWPDPDRYALAVDLAVVDAVIDRAAAPVHLVGHSFGGLLALLAAAARPDRVRSVAVYEPVAFGVLRGRDPEGLASLDAAITPAFLDAGRGGDEAWLTAFIDFWNGAGAWARLPEGRRAALRATGRKSFLEVRALSAEAPPLEALVSPCPTLLMAGSRSPRAALGVCRVLATGLPNARLLPFDGAGHMGPIEEPRRFVAAVAEHLGLHA